MPKTYKKLYEKIISWENLLKAYDAARKKKKWKKQQLEFHLNKEENLLSIRQELLEETWKPQPFRKFRRKLNLKERDIEAPCFRDRIVHHALVQVIEPLFEKKFISNSFACRKNKGTHKASLKIDEFIRKNSKNSFVLKCDVKKFFKSIETIKLFNILKRTISCKKTLNLIEKIILIREKSLPIGTLTSQLFSNCFLNELDHFLKNRKKIKFFCRYADDFVIVSNNKEFLHSLKVSIESFLIENLSLELNKKTSIFPIKHGIDFCGFRSFRTHKKARKRVLKAAKLKSRKLFKETNLTKQKVLGILGSFIGYVKHCNAKRSSKEIFNNFEKVLIRFA